MSTIHDAKASSKPHSGVEELYDEEHKTLKHRCAWLNCSECLCTYCILGGKKFHYHNMSIICIKHCLL